MQQCGGNSVDLIGIDMDTKITWWHTTAEQTFGVAPSQVVTSPARVRHPWMLRHHERLHLPQPQAGYVWIRALPSTRRRKGSGSLSDADAKCLRERRASCS